MWIYLFPGFEIEQFHSCLKNRKHVHPFLLSFSVNLLEFCHKCSSVTFYATHYLFCYTVDSKLGVAVGIFFFTK